VFEYREINLLIFMLLIAFKLGTVLPIDLSVSISDLACIKWTGLISLRREKKGKKDKLLTLFEIVNSRDKRLSVLVHCGSTNLT
jgi:hypothetical protein